MLIRYSPMLTSQVSSARTCTNILIRPTLIVRSLLLLLLGWPVSSVTAQSVWKAAADSSGNFLTKHDYPNAYAKGLRAALMDKPVQQADSVWTAISQLAKQLPDSVPVATALKAGIYYFMQNENDRAHAYLEAAIRKGDSLQLPQYQLQGRIMLAKVELRQQHTDNAVSLYRWVLRDTVSNECSTCQLDAMLGLAGYYASFQPDSARKTIQMALTKLQQLPNYKKNGYYPMIRMQLAVLAYGAGDQTTAIQEIEESYPIAKEIMPTNPLLTGIAYWYAQIIGDVNDEKALEATQTARRVLKRQPNHSKHPFYSWLLSNEVGLLRTLGRNAESVLLADSILQRHSLNELLQLTGSDALLLQITRTYVEARRDADLEKIVQKAQELLTARQKMVNPSYLYSVLGRYYQYKRNFAEAVRCLKEEIRLDSMNTGFNQFNYALINRLALCQAQAGQRADAYSSFSQSVAEFDKNVRSNLWLMSNSERDNYLQTTAIAGIFWHLIRHRNPQPEEVGLAYNFKLMQQGVRLKMSRTINQFAYTRNQSDSSLTTMRQLMSVRSRLADRSLANNPSDQRQLQQSVDSLERIMGKDATTLAQMSKTVRWQDVRHKLKPGEAAVEMVWYTNFSRNGQPFDSTGYSAFLIRPEWATPKVVQLPTPDDETRDHTSEEVAASRTATYYTNVVFSRKNQKERFETFWQPIATALGPVSRLYITLDGGYQILSLPTIQNPQTGRYLADDLELVVLNSTQDILEEPRTSASRVVELVGHPTYSLINRPLQQSRPTAKRTRLVKMRNGLTFKELPYTKIEIQQLSKLVKSFNLQPQERIDTAASEATFQQMKSPRVLHIATHGYLRDSTNQITSGQLLTCGLVLAGAADTVLLKNRTDGILTGYEASLLNLHDTELVVLSACETGVGDYYEGEGVNGLQRAFMLAGAKSVLVSLWRVNDELTQQLMTDFYRYWLSGLSKPQALRLAQRNLRRQHPEPYNWGAFVLLGQ